MARIDEVAATGSTRRSVLAGLAAAAGALAATSVAGAAPAEAANGDAVKAGRATTATNVTKVSNTADSGAGLWGVANGASRHGVFGTNTGGGHGVGGASGGSGSAGIHGTADGANAVAVWAQATNGAMALRASSDTGPCADITSDSGPALTVTSTSGRAAVLQSGAPGPAVIITGSDEGLLVSSLADGVHATNVNAGSSAIFGDSADGTGVRARSQTGDALRVEGPAAFSRSGVVTVAAGSTSAKVTGVPLTHDSLVLATVQVKGSAYVKQAVPNPATDSFVVYVNKATKDTPVAWFVVN